MHLTSEAMMTFDWYQMEGEDLAGRCRLKQCLSSSSDDAWYLTRFNRANAAVRVMISGTASTHGQLDAWRELLKLQHPNLVSVLDAGRAELGGTGVIYVVTEYPDDFLSAAVADRALSEGEAREVLSACLSALTYLHDKGLVHGAVDPAHIVSIGDRIKLTSDTIRPAGPDFPLTTDRSALGATLVEILTGKRPRPGAPVAKIPEPFAKIVERAFGADSAEQPSVKDLMEEVERPAGPVAVAPPAPEPVKIPPPPVAPEIPPKPTASPAPSPQPAAAGKPVMAPVKRGLPLKWVPLVGLAAALPLVLMMGRHPGSTTPAPPVVTERAAPEPLPPPSAAPSAVQPPAVKPAPVPPPRPAPPIRNPEAANPSDNWRVVVYEYRNRTAAEKEVGLLNTKHPAWHAEVFTPRTSRGVYLVSIGGWMTEEQAARVRREARAQGLPRDTFIRNFR